MRTAEATVATPRALRYLTQLCDHSARVGRHTGHGPIRAARDGRTGVITFDRGVCRLTATGDALVLRAEAADLAELRHIRDVLSARLERVGRRDALTVTWTTPGGG